MKTMPLADESTRRWKHSRIRLVVRSSQAPVVGVDDETAARGRLFTNVGFRQLNLVGRLDLWQRNFHRTLFVLNNEKSTD